MSQAPKKKRSTFIRLIALILPYKGLILFSLICMVGFNIFTAAPVYYAKDIVDGICLLYTSPSPRDRQKSRMPSSA